MAGLSQVVLVLLGLVIVVTQSKPTATEGEGDVDIRMPNVQPQVADTYLCMARKLRKDAEYVTGFVPHANMSTAHHILLYGCTEPGETDRVWNCGEMENTGSEYEQGPVCKDGSKIIYAWAMDAPELYLPEGVAFKVGGDTDIQWLVLQVHYKDVSSFVPPKSEKDHSGLTLKVTSTPQPKRAGVYLLGTDGELPPDSTIYMETACSFEEPVVIHPFAYRTHAHIHGEVVSGYRVRDGQWEEVGRMSPKKPQMFYSVTHPGMTVENGDILAARCTMVNHENRTVMIGQTQNDEMCNFYIMYWVEGDRIMSKDYCFSEGPPGWYWSDAEVIHAENAPNDASMVPGTDRVLKASQKFFEAAEETMEKLDAVVEENFADMFGEFQDNEQPQWKPELDLQQATYQDIDPDLLRALMMQQYPEYFVDEDADEDTYLNRLSMY